MNNAHLTVQALRSLEVDPYLESLDVTTGTVIDASGGRDVADVDDATACTLFLRWLDARRTEAAKFDRELNIKRRRASLRLLAKGAAHG